MVCISERRARRKSLSPERRGKGAGWLSWSSYPPLPATVRSDRHYQILVAGEMKMNMILLLNLLFPPVVRRALQLKLSAQNLGYRIQILGQRDAPASYGVFCQRIHGLAER